MSEKLNPAASWVFEAEVLILHHPTTISINYQAMGKKEEARVNYLRAFELDKTMKEAREAVDSL